MISILSIILAESIGSVSVAKRDVMLLVSRFLDASPDNNGWTTQQYIFLAPLSANILAPAITLPAVSTSSSTIRAVFPLTSPIMLIAST